MSKAIKTRILKLEQKIKSSTITTYIDAEGWRLIGGGRGFLRVPPPMTAMEWEAVNA